MTWMIRPVFEAKTASLGEWRVFEQLGDALDVDVDRAALSGAISRAQRDTAEACAGPGGPLRPNLWKVSLSDARQYRRIKGSTLRWSSHPAWSASPRSMKKALLCVAASRMSDDLTVIDRNAARGDRRLKFDEDA